MRNLSYRKTEISWDINGCRFANLLTSSPGGMCDRLTRQLFLPSRCLLLRLISPVWVIIYLLLGFACGAMKNKVVRLCIFENKNIVVHGSLVYLLLGKIGSVIVCGITRPAFLQTELGSIYFLPTSPCSMQLSRKTLRFDQATCMVTLGTRASFIIGGMNMSTSVQ